MLDGAPAPVRLVMPNKSRMVRSYCALFSRGICEVGAMPCVQSGLVLTGVAALPGGAGIALPAPAVEPVAPGSVASGPECPRGSSVVPVVHAAARAAATSILLRQWNIALTSWVLICSNPLHDSGSAESKGCFGGSLMFRRP